MARSMKQSDVPDDSTPTVRNILQSHEPRTVDEIAVLTRFDRKKILYAFKQLGDQLVYRGVTTEKGYQAQLRLQQALNSAHHAVAQAWTNKRLDWDGIIALNLQASKLQLEQNQALRDENRWEVTLWSKLSLREKIGLRLHKMGVGKSKGGWRAEWPEVINNAYRMGD